MTSAVAIPEEVAMVIQEVVGMAVFPTMAAIVIVAMHHTKETDLWSAVLWEAALPIRLAEEPVNNVSL